MTVPSAPAAGSPFEPPSPASPVAPLAEELLRALVKAVRAHQLYLPNNPMYAKSLELVRAAFVPLWAQLGELALTVTESEFRLEDVAVHSDPERSADSLPWLFYKDGVRELSLRPGFEEEEVVRLLAIIKRARKASAEEDDLLTMLWEQDFGYLRYRFVDLALENAPPLTPEAVHIEAGAAPSPVAEPVPAPRPGVVNLDEFDSTLYFLDEQEIEYLRAEVRAEYARDLATNVTGVLLDILETQTADVVRDEVCSILDGLLVHLLAVGDFRAAAHLLRESAVAAKRAKALADRHGEALAGLPDHLSAPESLAQLLQSLDDAAQLPDQQELNELFEQLRPRALESVFLWLSKLQNAAVRAMLEAAAARLAGQNTAELVRLIGSRTAEVALEAMRRASTLKTAAAVAPLGKVLGEPAARLRLAAVLALAEIGSAGAMQQLERGVEDDDRDVRVATVKALGARGHRASLQRVRAAIDGRVARAADLSERMAFFEAFGALAGDGGVARLDELLNGKGLFGRRADPEVRACAAMALGRIGTPRATDTVRKAANDKELLVRNAVAKALRGTQA